MLKIESSARTIGADDLADAWCEPLSTWVQARVASQDLRYFELTPKERDDVICACVRQILSPMKQAGSHRQPEWETGWQENLDRYTNVGQSESLIPHYFGKLTQVRWMQNWITPVSTAMEYSMLGLLLDQIFDTRIPGESDTVYEFGCGTGHNLLRLRERHPDFALWGLDWTKNSQEILKRCAEQLRADLHGHRFDFFEPDTSFSLRPKSTVITVAALEQVGDRYHDFLNYLISQPASRVVHVEPVAELLDPGCLPDLLSIEYFKKRNYLRDFLVTLEQLQRDGRIEILEAKRSYIGSLFIDGYSIITWQCASR